jgi:hypothetical protein
MIEKGKELAKQFEKIIGMSELKSLSKLSLEQPLTDNQFERIMILKKKLLS